MQENTVWIQRTDGVPICNDCVYWNTITRTCAIRKNEQSSTLHPVSCNYYVSEMAGE